MRPVDTMVARVGVALVLLALHGFGAPVQGQCTAWDTLTLFDEARQRTIPIATMHSPTVAHPQLVVISHGYNANKPGTYLLFSSLAQALCQAGFAVVSVQHEQPGDEALPMKGDLRVARRPIWDRGVENLRFVLTEMAVLHPDWQLDQVDLVGHSNGGDISMLFATLRPQAVRTVISLDNLRMPLPRTREPRVATLRAQDTKADGGVLPTEEEQARFTIQVIPMAGFDHADMNDRADDEQRTRLNSVVLELLRH